MLAIQFKMARKAVENEVQIELADYTDTEFVLASHSPASSVIGSIERMHGDSSLKVSNTFESGGTRRISRAVCLTTGCCKSKRFLRWISRRDAEDKSGQGRISAADCRTRLERHD